MYLGVIRLSDLKDDGAQTSPIRQREAITSKYATLGVEAENITWVEDLDVSAFHVPPLKRPRLRRAFDTLPRGSTVVFYRLDRFVRRVFPDFSDMISYAADNKLALVSATEPLDLSGPIGMMAATMIAFIGQMESENTSARVKNTHSYFRSIGRWKGALLPYGYRHTRMEGRPGWWLEIDPETATVIRDAVFRVLKGYSVNATAAWLNEQGVLPPIDRARVLRGKPRLCQCGHAEHAGSCSEIHKCRHRKRVGSKLLKLHEYDQCSEPCPEYRPRVWLRESLQEILRSPALCGYVVENKTQIVRDRETGMPVSFAEGVIEFETWQQLQAQLDGRSYNKVRTQSASLLLNVAYCDCGQPLYLANRVKRLGTGEEKVYEYYRPRSGACPGTRVIPVAALDELVQRELLATLGHLETLRREEGSQRRTAIEVELRAVAAQIVELTQEMFVQGRPRENHAELMAELQDRHTELTADLDLELEPEVKLVPTGVLFRNKWTSMGTVERRLWLMDAGVRVVAVRGRMPPVDFGSLPVGKRSRITATDGDVNAVIYLGNLGKLLRRAEHD